MPISGRYTWKESDSDLTLEIPFRGKSIKKVDIFVADTILKVSHPPYLLDLNLAQSIRTNSCKSILKDGVLVINLRKSRPGLWHKLIYEGTKDDIKTRRRESLLRREDEIRKQHEKARLTKLEEERMTLRNQMNLEQTEHQHIEDLKNKEKKEAEDKLYETIAQWNNKERSKPCEIASSCPTTDDQDDIEETKNGGDSTIPTTTHHKQDDQVSPTIGEEEYDNVNAQTKNTSILPVRGASCVRFRHTPRIFKTPMRESTFIRETEFLIKNRPNLRNNKYFNTDEDKDVSKVDPLWLKKKGDEFYLGNDYLSAINAYSDALEKNNDLLQALTNRSACYLHIGEPERCACDGEEALRLIQNGIPHSSMSDAVLNNIHKKVLIRMATAHCQLGESLMNFQNAIECIQKAIDLDTSDGALRLDLEQVKNICEAFQLKTEADDLFANGKIGSAINIYKKAISKENTLISAKVNCATAYLLQNSLEECMSLCDEVLCELKETTSTHDCSSNSKGLSMYSIPMPGTARRRSIVLSILYKKSHALTELQNFDKAISTLEMAKNIAVSCDKKEKIDEDIDRFKKAKKQHH